MNHFINQQPEFLPISINVTGKKILIVGGGNVALTKVKSLRRFDVSITVIGIMIEPALMDMDDIHIIRKSYDPSDLEGFFMVYACTDNKHTNLIIQEHCHAGNILVSLADNPVRSDFVSPAIYKKDDLTVAVGSNARDVKKSVGIRDQIKKNFESGLESPLTYEANNYDRRRDSPTFRNEVHDQRGRVVLAGFGPGDPGLMTLKTNQYLQEADVIFHDSLIDVDYLEHYRAEKILVGKRSGRHHMKQDEINQLLIEAAVNGKKVVRLKGGDPLVFGRGGEEIQTLTEQNIEVEVVPGITSVFAAAAQYRIPLTHRGIASSVVFCAGHDASNRPFPKANTLVLYMGARQQCEISKALIEEGWSKNTPVALMSNISNPGSKAIISQLGKLCRDQLMPETPLLIIVGEVVHKMPEINDHKQIAREFEEEPAGVG
ncbi:MAG: uroporphyrinogen-III C-methyltransferase [Marinilabilia sp.]